MKKLVAIMMTGVMFASMLCGCGAGETATEEAATEQTTEAEAETETAEAETTEDGEEATLSIAYQYGLSYAPIAILQEKNMIEEEYEALTGKTVNVVWNQMSSGADINTGFASGDINVGFMGIAPAVTGATKNAGYKIFTNLSGSEYGLMVNDDEIKTLDDLVNSDKQVALVNIGSFDHIIFAKALADNGYDAHALDANIVAMKHPDGMAALSSGSVACHFTTNPYIDMERAEGTYLEIPEFAESWSAEGTHIVGVASEELKNNDEELYTALCNAVQKSIDFINENKEETAAITCELDGNTAEDELTYLNHVIYSTETKRVFELAQFMADNDFLDNAPADFSDLAFDNVVGD